MMEMFFKYVSLIIDPGTEEDYSELSQLLEDISSYQRDFAAVREEEGKRRGKRN